MLAANLAETAARIEDTEWLSTTVAVENVCPRGYFEYPLTTPAVVGETVDYFRDRR